MTILNAFRDGVRRVLAAPAVVLGVFALTFLVALPLGVVLAGMIAESLGDSLAAATAASGVNTAWWQEFAAQATGVGTAFTPRTIGFGGVLDNLSGILDNSGHPLVVGGAGAAYLLAWLFVAGGVLDRLARNRRVRTAAFFGACGVFFFRFLRLGAAALAAYALLLGLHGWLFGGVYPWATHDMSAERSAFVVRAALYALFAILLSAVNLLFDYAKIRAVVEDRRSMVGALMAAFRFVARRPAEAIGLYLLNGAAFVALIVAYGVVAPGAGGMGWSLWLGLLVTQLYLLVRIGLKLVFYASQVSLFQSSLAHAGYTALPAPTWPDSPAAEAIAPEAPAAPPSQAR
jgi:hypothetical protein